ncbi:MAG: aldehyde ferredoxin oxidoreductase N-terminal domain-containing protein [Planctomycetota bacterium]|jgi:aldehyde:ferredoxin oxidoreductase
MALNRKIAYINLDTNEIDVKSVPREWRRKFLGGRGLNAYLLFKQTSPGCDPLGPSNTVIISSGLLGGTLTAPFECAHVVAKSPLTQLLGRATLSGFFGSEMRWAGFDHLVVKGRARHPVYLWIHNGNIQIREAKDIWGKGVFESRYIIRRELGDENVRLICIGPAGENLVRYGNITADRNQVSGRTGLGAVLGSKNVKAIVCRGEMDIQIKHPAAALKHQKKFLDSVLSTKGSASGPETAREDESAHSNTRLAESGEWFENPFYPGNRLLADLGLDPLAAEGMIQWAIALYENKIITDKDTGGVQLWPGNSKAVQAMITQIAAREGFGDILAQGPVQAAQKIGADSLKFFTPQTRLIRIYTEGTFDAVPHTLTSQSLRRSKRAKQHITFNHYHLPEKDDDRSGETGDRTADLSGECQKHFTGSAGKVLWQDIYEMASHCLGFCMGQIPCLSVDLEDFAMFKKLIQLSTGLTISEKDLQDCAYRCYAIERFFNLRESAACRQKQGRDHEFDFPVGLRIPDKLMKNFDLKKLRRLVNDHYRLNEWDKAAVLKLKKFKELELSDLWPLVKPKGDR